MRRGSWIFFVNGMEIRALVAKPDLKLAVGKTERDGKLLKRLGLEWDVILLDNLISSRLESIASYPFRVIG